jgi:hypothetical protein
MRLQPATTGAAATVYCTAATAGVAVPQDDSTRKTLSGAAAAKADMSTGVGQSHVLLHSSHRRCGSASG